MTLLVEWAVRQFGKALLYGMAAVFIGSVIAAFASDSSWLAVAYIGGPVVFAATLYLGKAPTPMSERDIVEVGQRDLTP